MTKRNGGVARRYKPYPAYKDSAVEWPIRIPTHWETLKLKRVCILAYGDSLSNEARSEGDVQVYGSNGPIGFHNTANTLEPCIVIGRKGSFGKVNYSMHRVFAIDTTFYVDNRYTRADLRWLYYTLCDANLDAATRDSAIPGLDREDAYSHYVCVCPPREQRSITAFLDCETSKIDSLIAGNEKLIELLIEKRTALVTCVATKGLNSGVQMMKTDVEWLEGIPRHWKIAPLYAKYEVALGKMLDAKRFTGNSPGHYLRNVDVQWDRVNVEDLPEMDFAPWERDRYRLCSGDLLVCEGGEVGRTAVWQNQLDECFYQKAIHRLRPRSEQDVPRFFFYLMYSYAKQGVFVSSGNPNTIDHLTAVKLSQFRFPFPPLDEQLAIAAHLDQETARIDASIAKIREAIDRLRELRTTLISSAVTGKIDVREDSP
jgi:type I restriction enzyme S subunit